jgi:sugar-specific transcriptional regulator TrmB
MDFADLERIGLNRNEARVYLALTSRGQATAAELVKAVGVHRNIVYDNIEKLIEKGLVSFIIDGTKKRFIAENPQVIIDYLESKKDKIDEEIKEASKIIPQITALLATTNGKQEATIFRGIKGLKKVFNDTLKSKEIWDIGLTNESVQILSSTFWKNYNQKIKDWNIKEHILVNYSYKDTSTGLFNIKNIETRILPQQLDQVTETIIWDEKVAIFVYSAQPIVIVMENKEIFNMYKAHFDFLWKISKNPRKK